MTQDLGVQQLAEDIQAQPVRRVIGDVGAAQSRDVRRPQLKHGQPNENQDARSRRPITRQDRVNLKRNDRLAGENDHGEDQGDGQEPTGSAQVWPEPAEERPELPPAREGVRRDFRRIRGLHRDRISLQP